MNVTDEMKVRICCESSNMEKNSFHWKDQKERSPVSSLWNEQNLTREKWEESLPSRE